MEHRLPTGNARGNSKVNLFFYMARELFFYYSFIETIDRAWLHRALSSV